MQSASLQYRDLSAAHKFCILAMLFFVTSFLGWALETLGFYMTQRDWYERGFLWLPFCTLYGFSLAGIYAIMRTPQSGIWNKMATAPHNRALRVLLRVVSLFLYTLAAALLATLVELITGLFYHRVFGIRLWDYRGFAGNLGGYVVLEYSVLWGVGATAAMGLVWHPLQAALVRADTKILVITVCLLTAMLSADFIFNIAYLQTTGSHYPFFPEVFIQTCRLLRP